MWHNFISTQYVALEYKTYLHSLKLSNGTNSQCFLANKAIIGFSDTKGFNEKSISKLYLYTRRIRRFLSNPGVVSLVCSAA